MKYLTKYSNIGLGFIKNTVNDENILNDNEDVFPYKIIENKLTEDKTNEEEDKFIEDIEPLETLSEIHDLDLTDEFITLKSREDVYYEIYRQARKKARLLKHQALLAFLEAKNIKKTYMLDDLEEDDSVISDLDFKSIEESLKYNLEV